MNTSISTLATVTALGADCVVVNETAYIKGLPPMIVGGIKPTSVVAPVTEVLQVTTGTPTAANSTLYAINLVYSNRLTGVIESLSISYTSDATANATEICDFFRSAINSNSAILPISATGTATLILTAVAGVNSAQAQFTATSFGTGAITFVTGTPAVIGVGKGAFINGGIAPSVDVVESSYYYQVVMDSNNFQSIGSTMDASTLTNRNILYVLSTATNVETLVGTYGTVTYMLAGRSATWSASGGTIAFAATTGVITIATDTFASAGLLAGDITMIGATTALAVAQASSVLSILTQATAVGSNVAAVGAATGFYVKVRSI
jgi:hypothetical protein